jgi:SulP family sulfate permease
MIPNPSYYWCLFIPKLFICLREGYSLSILRKDIPAGLTVAIISFPLAMALAIASGVPPERGLYTAIIAGFLISFFGGSRYQIGGPTGAFVIIVYSIVQQYGYDGLAIATLMAGMMLIIMGFAQFGSMIKYMPYPLITGFTAGIAVVIFSLQVKDFLGLSRISPPVLVVLRQLVLGLLLCQLGSPFFSV